MVRQTARNLRCDKGGLHETDSMRAVACLRAGRRGPCIGADSYGYRGGNRSDEAEPADADDDADEAGEDKKKDDFDIGQMMAVFDKLFPAQPDPLPARLALSRVTVKRSDRTLFASDLDRWKPSSGMIARLRGSTQKMSSASRLSAIGKIPAA